MPDRLGGGRLELCESDLGMVVHHHADLCCIEKQNHVLCLSASEVGHPNLWPLLVRDSAKSQGLRKGSFLPVCWNGGMTGSSAQRLSTVC